MYIYIYIHTYTYIYIYIYIHTHTYIERERERERAPGELLAAALRLVPGLPVAFAIMLCANDCVRCLLLIYVCYLLFVMLFVLK